MKIILIALACTAVCPLNSALRAEGLSFTNPPAVSPRRPVSTSPATRPSAAPKPHSIDELGALMPPPAPGTTPIGFKDLFKPIGARGLEYTDRIQALNGRSVRLVCYRAEQESATPGSWILVPWPQALHEEEYGLCDDLPGTTVYVLLDPAADAAAPRLFHSPLVITGTLQLGQREEAGGRNSAVRIFVTAGGVEPWSATKIPTVQAATRLPDFLPPIIQTSTERAEAQKP